MREDGDGVGGHQFLKAHASKTLDGRRGEEGMEVWRTINGTSWQQVNPNGFGDSNNWWPYWDNSVAVFKDSLYVGTWN